MRKDLEEKDERTEELKRQVVPLKSPANAEEQSLPLDLLGEAQQEDELNRRLSTEKQTYSRSVDEC